MFWPGGMAAARWRRRGRLRRDPRSRRFRWGSRGCPARTRPRPASRWGDDEHAGLDAGGGDAGESPAAGDFAENIGALQHDTADLQGIDVVDDQATIFSVVAIGAATCCGILWAQYMHRRYCGDETVAGQSEVLLLAALDFVRDAFHVIEAVEGGADAAYSDESARFEDAAIAGDIERAFGGNGFGCLRGGCEADHDGLRDGHFGHVVSKWLEIGGNEIGGEGRDESQRRIERGDGRNGNGNGDARFLVVDVDDGDAVLLLVELEVHALNVGVGVHIGVERGLWCADFDLRTQ
jgi:hypothetical protein